MGGAAGEGLPPERPDRRLDLGVLTLVFQDGRLQKLQNYTSNGGVEPTDFLVAAALVVAPQIGVATAAGVLIDAFVIRALLVPALMGLLGSWNWWSPAPLRRLHGRIGLEESAPVIRAAGLALRARAPASPARP